MQIFSKLKYSNSLATLLCLLLMSLTGNQALAAPVYTFSGTPTSMEGPWTFEQRFTVGTQGFVIDALGFWDYQGNGLEASHLVGIFDASGTLLRSTTIGAGTGNSLQDGFRWQSIAQLTVDPGTTILLVAQQAGDFHNMTNGMVLDSRIASEGSGYVGGITFDPNAIPEFTNNRIWAANFNIAEVAAVPEPASLALLSLGLFGLGFSRRKKA